MNQTGQFLFGVGATVLGVGFALLYQGLALRNPEKAKNIGGWAFTFGIIWCLMGLYFAVVGVAAMQTS